MVCALACLPSKSNHRQLSNCRVAARTRSNILFIPRHHSYLGVTMTEPLRKYHSSDVPEFASYPAEPDRATAEVIEFSVISEYDALPETFARGFDVQGRKLGSALGRLVRNFNDLKSSFRSKVEH